MVKPLVFKGEKKPKKRKRPDDTNSASAVTGVRADPFDDESWSGPDDPSQLTGPTIIVLPTVPPTCLASDAHGNVFASPLENMVEGDAKTAEPHDVRQVWVASRVVGMSEGEFNFKGSHGGYLSCDEYGILGARREARGKEEGFTVEMITGESGRDFWCLRTTATKNATKIEERKYLCAQTETTGSAKQKSTEAVDADNRIENKKISISLRGDGELSAPETHLLIRMQSRFMPQSQTNREAARVKEKMSRRELESAAGKSLTDEEIKRLKRAKKEGFYHEEILDIRAKGKHDKFA